MKKKHLKKVSTNQHKIEAKKERITKQKEGCLKK